MGKMKIKHSWKQVVGYRTADGVRDVSVCIACHCVRVQGVTPTKNPVKPFNFTKYILNGQVSVHAPDCKNFEINEN
jgi:hypothetical protein